MKTFIALIILSIFGPVHAEDTDIPSFSSVSSRCNVYGTPKDCIVSFGLTRTTDVLWGALARDILGEQLGDLAIADVRVELWRHAHDRDILIAEIDDYCQIELEDYYAWRRIVHAFAAKGKKIGLRNDRCVHPLEPMQQTAAKITQLFPGEYSIVARYGESNSHSNGGPGVSVVFARGVPELNF